MDAVRPCFFAQLLRALTAPLSSKSTRPLGACRQDIHHHAIVANTRTLAPIRMKVFSRRRTKEATPSSLQGSPTESRPETPRAKQQAPTGPSLLQTQPSRNSPRLAAKSVAPSPVLTPDTNAVPDQGKAGSSARKRRGTEPFQPQEDDASQAASSAAVPRGPAFDNNPAPPFKKAGSLLAQRPASRSSPRRKASTLWHPCAILSCHALCSPHSPSWPHATILSKVQSATGCWVHVCAALVLGANTPPSLQNPT